RSSTGQVSGSRSTTQRSAWWPRASAPIPSQRSTCAASLVHIASASSRVRPGVGDAAPLPAYVGSTATPTCPNPSLRPHSPGPPPADGRAGAGPPPHGDEVLHLARADPLAPELALSPRERHARRRVQLQRGHAPRLLRLDEVQMLEQPCSTVGGERAARGRG